MSYFSCGMLSVPPGALGLFLGRQAAGDPLSVRLAGRRWDPCVSSGMHSNCAGGPNAHLLDFRAGAGEILYTRLSHCTECGESLTTLKSGCHVASVWNGAKWRQVTHGQKRCYECGDRFNLTYRPLKGEKQNTLECPEDDDIVLLNPFVGFDYHYLRQRWNRTCRVSVSTTAEAATILLTWPRVSVGNRNKARSAKGVPHMREDKFRRLLITALFNYLRLSNEEYDFDVADPVPAQDPIYGKPNRGTHVIFNIARDDVGFSRKRKYDIVTDSNQPLRRRLAAGEESSKRLPGAPCKRP